MTFGSNRLQIVLTGLAGLAGIRQPVPAQQPGAGIRWLGVLGLAGLSGFWIEGAGALGALGALGLWNHPNPKLARWGRWGWVGVIGLPCLVQGLWP